MDAPRVDWRIASSRKPPFLRHHRPTRALCPRPCVLCPGLHRLFFFPAPTSHRARRAVPPSRGRRVPANQQPHHPHPASWEWFRCTLQGLQQKGVQGTGPSRFSLVLLPMRPLPRAVGFVEGSRMWSAWRGSACFGGQKPAANRLHRVVLASAACHSLGMPGGFLWARPRRRSIPCCVPGFQGSLAFVLRHPAEIRAASCSHHEKASASGRPYCSRCTRSCASAAFSWVFFSLSCRVNARQLGGWGWRLAAPCRMQPCSQTPPHVEAVSQTRPVGFAAAPAPAQSGTRVADTVSKPAAHSEPMARGSLTCKSLSNLSHSHRWARCNAAQRH